MDQKQSRKKWKVLPAARPRSSIFFFPQACSFTYSTEILLWTTVPRTYAGQTVHKGYRILLASSSTGSWDIELTWEWWKIDSIMLSHMIYRDRRTFGTTATFCETFSCSIIRELSDARGGMTMWSHLVTSFYPVLCGFVVFNNIPVMFPSKFLSVQGWPAESRSWSLTGLGLLDLES